MLWGLRIAFLAAAVILVTLAFFARDHTSRVLRRFFGSSAGPFNLAVLRILVFSELLWSLFATRLDWLLAVPRVLRQLPPGWRWLSQEIVFHPNLAESTRAIGILAAGLTVLGIATRITGPIAACSAVYILGLPNFFTKINHAEHALIWFSLVLGFSPCGETLSVQTLLSTWRRGKPRLSSPAVPQIAFALPIRLCWLLLGVAYFFPGFWKLWTAGDQWITGQAVVARLFVGDPFGFEPLLHAYESRFVMVVAGAGTLLVELGFVLLVFSRHARWLAPLIGLSFHLGVWALMDIHFTTMMKMYLVFVDFEWVVRRFEPHLSPLAKENLGLWTQADTVLSRSVAFGRAIPSLAVGVLLLVANAVVGATRISTWPVSVFPRFDNRVSRTEPNRCTDLVTIRGKTRAPLEVDPTALDGPINGPRWRFLIKRLLKTKDRRERAKLFRATRVLLAHSEIQVSRGDELVIYEHCSHPDGTISRRQKTSHSFR